MEHISCPLCESEQYVTYFEQEGVDEYKTLIRLENESSNWVRCENCDFIYHQPQLSNAELQELYDKFRDETIRSETPDEYFDRITGYPPGESENYQKAQWIIKHLPKGDKLNSLDSIFDVGCGGGVFLWTIRELLNPKNISGLEPTKSFAELASRRLKTEIFNQIYDNPVDKFRKHNLITINQVLEHVKNPKAFVLNLKNNLVINGNVYIEVPSETDFKSLPSNHDRFKAQHLWYFSEDSLINLFKNSGFSCKAIETASTVRGRNNIQAIFELV